LVVGVAIVGRKAGAPPAAATIGLVEIVRGNVVMEGYYRDPEATSKVIRNGWFHIGDAAVVHPDGYIEIRDRLKDVIMSGGENISSVEVEGIPFAPSGHSGSGRGWASAREVG